MNIPFTDCCWIGPDWKADCGGEENRYYAYRKFFSLPAGVKKGSVLVTADARYLLWVNGQFVGRGPARCFPERQSYDRYDLAPFLKKGENWIAVLVHQFGKSNGQYIYRYRTGLLMQGELQLTNASRILLRTDLAWQVRQADWYLRTHARISQHLGFQERFDAVAEPKNWQNPAKAQKALTDPAWQKPFYVGPPGCAPWTGFEPRHLEPMTETLVKPVGITWAAAGKNAPNIHSADNLLHIWDAEKRKRLTKLPAFDPAGYVRVAPAGTDFIALAFDFGWNHAAYAKIDIRDARGGEIIDSFYAAGLPSKNKEPDPARGFGDFYEGMADRFIAAPGKSAWQSFAIRGYRQHIVVIRTKHPLRIRVTALRTHHTVQPRGQFECSDPALNAIWTTSDRTLKAGMLDAFVDNNFREQAQWLHDGCVIGPAAWATYGDTALWRRGLLQWGQSHTQYPNHVLNSMSPMENSFTGIPDYSFAWVASLLDYYQTTGDLSLLKESLEPLSRLVRDLIFPNITRDGLFIQPEGYWLFLDWSNFDMSPYSLVLNLMLLRALLSAATVTRLCKDHHLETECLHQEQHLRQAIAKRFWSKKQNAWLENIEPSPAVKKIFNKRLEKQDTCPWNIGWPRAKPKNKCSRHSNALAVLTSLGTPGQQQKAAAFVARSMKPKFIADNALSHMWVDKIYGVLCESGHDRDVLTALREYHEKWIEKGATTWSELWDADATTHAQTYGAAVNWVLTSYILGIRPLKPGFTEVNFDPRPGDLAWAKGVVPTPLGDIRVSWVKNQAGRIMADIHAPRGIKVINSA